MDSLKNTIPEYWYNISFIIIYATNITSINPANVISGLCTFVGFADLM